jgi:hypothetical protein
LSTGFVLAFILPFIGGIIGAPFMVVGGMTLVSNYFMEVYSSTLKKIAVLLIFIIMLATFFAIGWFCLFCWI